MCVCEVRVSVRVVWRESSGVGGVSVCVCVCVRE